MKPMSEKQIEALAAERLTADQADGTYLRALIVASQSKLSARRGGKRAALAAIEESSAVYYAAVLRGVMTVDIIVTEGLEAAEAQRRVHERNRRATFARSAKSTIVAWVREGGDLRSIDADTVTKTELRVSVAASRTKPGVAVDRAQAAILKAIANESPESARTRLEAVMEALQAALDDLPEAPSTRRRIVRATLPAPRPGSRMPAPMLNG